MDTLTPAQRSVVMSRVKSKDSRPEMIVRRVVHAMGYRYRLHVKDLPGRPDLVFRPRKAIIFVHGCFWHRHANCPLTRTPKAREDFWLSKFAENRNRDRRVTQKLRRLGWRVLVIWECQVRDVLKLGKRVRSFLDAEC
jgi:DNA mismatch endonuclease, patch repair protein